MNLEDFAKEALVLKKSFREPWKVGVLYIDKDGKAHEVKQIDTAFWGTRDDNKLTVLIYEEKQNEELPF